MENILLYALPPIAITIFVFLSGFFTVKHNTALVIERFGKFRAVRHAGLHFKIPVIDKVSDRYNLKIQQLDIPVETKTKENIFVVTTASVQFKINPDMIYEAYCINEPYEQLIAHVYDVIRAEVPKLRLNEAFESKDAIAAKVSDILREKMSKHGYTILNVLTTDIEPDAHIKNAMNRINAADLEKSAAEYEAEALRINILAKATAEAESKRLEGQGIANQRREIAKGLMESVDVLGKAGISTSEASALLMLTHHYDTLKGIGNEGKSNLIMMPNSPQDSKDMINSMLSSFTKNVPAEPENDGHKIIRFPNQAENQAGDYEILSNQL
ncbi:SPFH domain-containing protein [Flavobacterium sp.]|uniref:SPFH domain-containing protein n=1 Tax=Flavobacterium sp. TaxID=239 RepID=UPI00260BED34|nr:SPFH domain-containing protein [Flavobacterium sp.]